MRMWLIQPRDGALFRDARPLVGNASAISMPMPWPSTLAGFARSRIGMSAAGRFELEHDEARAIGVVGPWLARLAPDGAIEEHLFAAPADALFHTGDEEASPDLLHLRRLGLIDLPEGAVTNLPDGLRPVGLLDPPESNPGKPSAGPAFWTSAVLSDWLSAPKDHRRVRAAELGVGEPLRDERIHVGIDPEKIAAEDTKLFMTESRSFTILSADGTSISLGVVCETDDVNNVDRFGSGPGCLGGDRKLSHVRPVENAGTLLPLPDVTGASLLRVVLLTPGIFARGFMPNFGEGATVVAACVGRPHPVSGWSFEHSGPKPSRRMAPAGSVYWVKVDGDPTEWAQSRHFTTISDDEQDRRDGFGLVAVGVA